MKPVLRAAVSLGVLAVLALLLPWTDLLAAASRMSGRLWLGVLLGFLTGHAVGVFKWRLLLAAAGSPVPGRVGLRCYAAGLFANLCLPSIIGGDVLRALLVGRAHGRLEAAFLAGVADRLIDTFALGILIVAGTAVAGTVVLGASEGLVLGVLVVIVVTGALVLRWVGRRPLAAWPARFRRGIARALGALRRLLRMPLVALAALALALVVQSSFVLLNVWIGRGLGIALPIGIWFVAWPVSKLAGLLPISLGGLGVRDATFGALLVPLGVPMALGVLSHLVWQTVLVAGGLLAGLLWWLLADRIPTGARPAWRGMIRDAGGGLRRG